MVAGPSGGSDGPNRDRRAVVLVAVAVVALLAVAAIVLVTMAVRARDELRTTEGSTPGNEIPLDAGAGPTSAPTERWSTEVGCTAAPGPCTLVADDDLVVARVWIDGEARLVSYDPGTGDVRWNQPAHEQGTYPFLVGPHLFTVTSPNERVTDIELLDRETGEPQWTSEVGKYARPGGLVADDALLVMADADQGFGETAAAVDLETGRVRWTEQGWLLASCGNVAYLAQSPSENESRLVAIAVDDGDLLWSFPDDREALISRGGCTGDGNVAVVRNDASSYGEVDPEEAAPVRKYEVTVHRSDDGEPVWSQDLGESDAGSVFETSQDLVIVGGSESLLAFDAGTGEQAWRSYGGFDNGLVDSLVVDGRLVTADPGTEVRLIDLMTGGSVASVPRPEGELKPTDQALVFVGDGQAASYHATTLDEQWTLPADEALHVALGSSQAYILSGEELTAYR